MLRKCNSPKQRNQFNNRRCNKGHRRQFIGAPFWYHANLFSVNSSVDTRYSDFLDPATSSQMETHPTTAESFLPPSDHQPFSTTVVSTSLTATLTGIIQQTTSTSTSFLSTSESMPDFPENSSNRAFTTIEERHPMHLCPYNDCTGGCTNTPPDFVTASHQVALLLSTYDPDADPATIHSAASQAIGLLEREKKRRKYPSRQWTPSPIPFFGGQGISEPLSRILHDHQLLTS